MKNKSDLVIIDWGIGGLSVLTQIKLLMPKLSILYHSDSGQKPYGKMTPKELEKRLRYLVYEFEKQGHKSFVIACNAASTVLPKLKTEFELRGLQVCGVIESGIRMAAQSKFTHLGIIGGRRTILSRMHAKGLRKAEGHRKVTGRIAQPLSALIEKGELKTPRMEKLLRQILAPLRECDALLLACTHYPAVSGLIQNILPGCVLLDPARETAKFVEANWEFGRVARTRKKRVIYQTTGDKKQMILAARLAFDIEILGVYEDGF